MKVLMINGSPHREGSTHQTLSLVADELEEAGIETEEYWIGTKPVPGCTACGKCGETGRCIFEDGVNEVIGKMDDCDGLVIGSPTYFASPNGSLLAFLDRLYYIADFSHKPAAVVTVARRGGTTATLEFGKAAGGRQQYGWEGEFSKIVCQDAEIIVREFIPALRIPVGLDADAGSLAPRALVQNRGWNRMENVGD